MKNLLFFLWMLFFPLVEDICTYIVWKTRGKPCPENHYDAFDNFMLIVIYCAVGYLLYEK